MSFFKNLISPQDPEEEKIQKFKELEDTYLGDDEMIANSKAQWLTSRANHYGQKRMLNEAIQSFNEAISLKNDFLPAYFGLAVAYKEQGDMKKALETIEKAPNEMKLFNEVIAPKEDAMKEM